MTQNTVRVIYIQHHHHQYSIFSIMAKVATTPTTTTGTTITSRGKVMAPPMKQDAMLQVFGFTQSTCSFCMKSIDDCNGLLMQCGKCRKVYFCSKKVRAHEWKMAIIVKVLVGFWNFSPLYLILSHFVHSKCFNDNVISHQETCTTSIIRWNRISLNESIYERYQGW